MGIFSRKLDIEKDHLRLVFNLEKEVYDAYYGDNFVPYQKLNRKSRKMLDAKNKLLKEDANLLLKEIEKAKTILRFNKLKSLGYSCNSFEYLGPNNGTMSPQVELFLNELVNEENVLIGVHRIGADDSPQKIADILTNGLEMTGHLGGIVLGSKQLNNNVSYYPNNKTIIKELLYANAYKASKGSILIRIPDDELTGNILFVDEKGKTRLKPKYIVGYVPLEENHHIETIIQKNNMRNSYSYNAEARDCDISYLEARNVEEEQGRSR